MSLRFARSFCELYDLANAEDWMAPLPADLFVLILAGDQDPVAGFGEGAYRVANGLWDAGLRDIRTRVYTGVRHEVHNEGLIYKDSVFLNLFHLSCQDLYLFLLHEL